MRLSATRFAPTLVALLLGCTVLGGDAHAWSLFGGRAKPQAAAKNAKDAKDVKAAAAAPSDNLDGSIQQAQLLRIAGDYPEAIRHLSQLMMVASDDPRVISEYGKSLAAMGRSQEAVNFLTRAQQLQPGDWTVYSALGVAYDQLGKQSDAQDVYEKALAIKPGEPSVLSNYALSRMLAKDPDMARKLIGRAEIAGGANDPKIARNMALIKEMAPAGADRAFAVNTPAPSPAPRLGAMAQPAAPEARVTQAAPEARVAQAAPLARVQPAANLPAPPALSTAPRPPAQDAMIAARPQAQPQPPRGVVMQRVPVDPLAGPVKAAAATAATRAPRSLTTAAPQPAASLQPAKTADAQAQDLQARAEAIAKTLAKPGAKAEAMAAANQPKPAQAAARPVAPAPVKAAAKPVAPKSARDTVPALRLSANAY